MDGLFIFLNKFKEPAMALLALMVLGMLSAFYALAKCYIGLLKANVRSVALLQTLVFGKRANKAVVKEPGDETWID
jgi:hypothetical protein